MKVQIESHGGAWFRLYTYKSIVAHPCGRCCIYSVLHKYVGPMFMDFLTSWEDEEKLNYVFVFTSINIVRVVVIGIFCMRRLPWRHGLAQISSVTLYSSHAVLTMARKKIITSYKLFPLKYHLRLEKKLKQNLNKVETFLVHLLVLQRYPKISTSSKFQPIIFKRLSWLIFMWIVARHLTTQCRFNEEMLNSGRLSQS